MLELKEENIKGLEMSFELDARQQSLLAANVRQEWFDTLQKLMEQEIRLLNINLMNTTDPQEILRNHAVAKGAAMFYTGFMQRLNTILQIEYTKASGVGSIANPEHPPMLEELS